MKWYADIKEKLSYYYDKKDDCYYSDDILCFDIETSSGWCKKNKKVFGYNFNIPEKEYNNFIPCSIPYIWQFSFNGVCYYGRELKDFTYILDYLNKQNVKCVIFVHNLGFEFVYLCNFLQPFKDVFARTPRKPMKVVSELYLNIEFRCSYFLTRLSLKNWGKQIGFFKDNPIDYSIIRTPNTVLTNDVLHYAEQDTFVMYKGLQVYLKRYRHIKDIPLTQTGEVRREVKRLLMNKRGYKGFISKLVPKDISYYKMLLNAFMGGLVHANYIYTERLLKNVKSKDLSSAYPFVMCAEKYPMEPFNLCNYNSDNKDYVYILDVTMYNIKCKYFNVYLSKSKLLDYKDVVTDNGRIMSAKMVHMQVTNLDYNIIEKMYVSKDTIVQINKCYGAKADYLPKEFIEYTLQLYNEKTNYKNVDGMEDIYLYSKQRVNSLYGMMVTSMLPDSICFLNGEWVKKVQTEQDIQKELNKKRLNSKNEVFLSFAWGVFVTAYTRYNLMSCFFKDDNGECCDKDVVYFDTDSFKHLREHTFNWFNEKCDYKLKNMCVYHDIDYMLTRPKDKDGIERPLGHFLEEYNAEEFITLGCKRYCYREKGELHITVSGVNKEAVSCLKNNILNFKRNFCFSGSEKDVKLNYLYYFNSKDNLDTVWNYGQEDEYINKDYTYGVCVRPKSYNMDISEEYSMYLNEFRVGNEEL